MQVERIYLVGVRFLTKVIGAQLVYPMPAAPDRHTEAASEAPPVTQPQPVMTSSLPTTSETVGAVKRDLVMEIMQIERDLLRGGRINGKLCDCLNKHRLGLESAVREIIPMDPDPVYPQLLSWLDAHGPEFEMSAVAKKDPRHYMGLTSQTREFRKRIMGTLSPVDRRES